MGRLRKKIRSNHQLALEFWATGNHGARVGKIEVGHGETNCKTPDAVTYVRKAVKHRRKKKSVKV